MGPSSRVPAPLIVAPKDLEFIMVEKEVFPECQSLCHDKDVIRPMAIMMRRGQVTVWPSGLRRQTQVLVVSPAWVRTQELSPDSVMMRGCCGGGAI